MSTNSGIEWTDHTWNPVRGCTRVSEGCRNCYAEHFAARFSGPGLPYEGIVARTPSGPRWTGQVRLVAAKLTEPLHWRKPSLVFVNSMSDLFHERLPTATIDQVFNIMEQASRHSFQVLTKRSGLMRDYVNTRYAGTTAPPHIWLGTSVEDRAALPRLDQLRQTHAAVRFISAEPLLESLAPLDLTGIHWVIVGGESERGARKMDPTWAREIRDACVSASVPFFFKQWGEYDMSGTRVGKERAGRILDGRVWDEKP